MLQQPINLNDITSAQFGDQEIIKIYYKGILVFEKTEEE